MKELWNTLRLASYVVILPMVATAVVSGHQWANQEDAKPLLVSNASTTSMMSTVRSHVVQQDANGFINGRLWTMDTDSQQTIGASGLSLTLIRNGQAISRGSSDLDGTFRMGGIEPGNYSFVAEGKNGFSMFGLKVVAHGDSSDGAVPMIESMTTSSGIKMIRSMVKDQTQKSANSISPATVPDSDEMELIANSNQVYLDGENTLRGRIYSIGNDNTDFNGTQISLIHDGVIEFTTTADTDGNYEFDNVEPGIYEFVCVGTNGIAALSFEAIQSQSTLTLVSYTETGTANRVQDTLEIPTISPQDAQSVFNNVAFVQNGPIVQNTPFNDGGVVTFNGGNFGGGFGNGPIGGNIGGLRLNRPLLFGGLAAGIAIPLAVGGSVTPMGPMSPSN